MLLVIGLFIGGFVGFVFGALMAAAEVEDQYEEKDN